MVSSCFPSKHSYLFSVSPAPSFSRCFIQTLGIWRVFDVFPFQRQKYCQSRDVNNNKIKHVYKAKYKPGRLVPSNLKKSKTLCQSVDSSSFPRALWSQCLRHAATLTSLTSTSIIFSYSCEFHCLYSLLKLKKKLNYVYEGDRRYVYTEGQRCWIPLDLELERHNF